MHVSLPTRARDSTRSRASSGSIVETGRQSRSARSRRALRRARTGSAGDWRAGDCGCAHARRPGRDRRVELPARERYGRVGRNVRSARMGPAPAPRDGGGPTPTSAAPGWAWRRSLDPMNADLRHRRVWLRREVIPRLVQGARRDLVAVLGRQAELLRADDDLLESLAAQQATDDAAALSALSLALARRIVRNWVATNSSGGLPPIERGRRSGPGRRPRRGARDRIAGRRPGRSRRRPPPPHPGHPQFVAPC